MLLLFMTQFILHPQLLSEIDFIHKIVCIFTAVKHQFKL